MTDLKPLGCVHIRIFVFNKTLQAWAHCFGAMEDVIYFDFEIDPSVLFKVIFTNFALFSFSDHALQCMLWSVFSNIYRF